MALIANCNRDPKKSEPFTYEQFHPYLIAKRKKPGSRAGLIAMAEIARANQFN